MAENGSAAGPGRFLRTYDIRIKTVCGIAAAEVHEEIRRWCAHNQAEGIENVKQDGEYYCYTSAQRIGKHVGYSKVTVERALKKLIAAGLIQKESRWGTKVHSFNPNAMLYFAAEYESCALVNSPNAYHQVEGTPYHQVEGTERMYSKRSKKSALDLKDARDKNETLKPPPATTITPRSADGFKHLGSAFEKRPQYPPIEKPLSEEWIKIDQAEQAAQAAAEAAQAAEQEKELITGLRDLTNSLLGSRDAPQDLRETIEAEIQGEFKNHYTLSGWIKQLQAMPKLNHEPVAVTEPEAVAEAAG